MNIKKSIKRILKEEIKVPLIIRRNVDFDLLDKDFNIALDLASERFREKKSKLKAMTPEKFGIMVTSNLMVELCHRYENLCMDDTGLYDALWDFIGKYYFTQTTKRFYDIVFDDINESVLKEETEDGMKDILFDMFDDNTQGAELYNSNGSLWMILPEEKVWVFEVQSDLRLLYNYTFFSKIYKYVSLDVVGHKHYITEWVEDILKTSIRNTKGSLTNRDLAVEDILKTSIRNTIPKGWMWATGVEDIIKKGKKIK